MIKSNIFRLFTAIFFGIILSSCSSDEFEIKGELSELGTQNIRFIYYANGGIQSNWIPTVDGKIEFTGASPEYTVLELYKRNNELLTRIIVKNGDEIEFKGSFKKPYRIEVTGNDLTEALSGFINKNASTFEKGDIKSIEKLIENHVRKNPNDQISPYLIAFYYANSSNYDKVEKLIKLIPEENKTDLIKNRIASYYDTKPYKTIGKDKIKTFKMYSDNDSIDAFNTSGYESSLLYFWAREDQDRKDIITKLKELEKKTNTKKHKKRLQIAEIGLENDSTVWHRTFATDSVKWKHYWALGEVMNSEVMKMEVKKSPYFMVLDSVGTTIYRGNSINTACDSIGSKFKK